MKLKSQSPAIAEMLGLLELWIEERISREQFQRLEHLLRADAAARRVYLQYVDLHGSLHWNAALSGPRMSGEKPGSKSKSRKVTVDRRAQLKVWTSRLSIVATVLVVALIWSAFRKDPGSNLSQGERERDVEFESGSSGKGGFEDIDLSMLPLTLHATAIPERRDQESVVKNDEPENGPINRPSKVVAADSKKIDIEQHPDSKPGSNESIVAFVNSELRRVWDDNEQQPSVVADDGEWLRRVYLDVLGHIPTAKQTREFLADKRPNKRELAVDELLDHEDYIRNWTTIWTNLMIGRSNPRQVNRSSMQRFLRTAFAKNRPWDEVVADIVSAEGSTEENGAANFLVAHVNNQAVPATAITAKLFLCQQVQCTQCHDHPFNDLKQDSFWSFNSFFKDIKVVERAKGKSRETVIERHQHPGAIYYELRNGLMKVAYPKFEGEKVDHESGDLRSELAKLMRQGDAPQMARGFVNRMWQHFMGAAFTPQVDDMGPHVRVSHPAILDRLTREFVRSNYDVKQLVRWICRSEPYQLSSRFGAGEYRDDPTAGYEPLFSRMYVKRMSVEQAFDSLLVATDAKQAFGSDWDDVEKRRQAWLNQFVRAFGTDENDEADLFDGTIPQALMLMNGDLIQQAIAANKGTYIDRVVRERVPDDSKIEALSLAALSRKPTPAEVTAVRNMVRENASHRGNNSDRTAPMTAALQDLFWAYLNSNEFILIH